VRWDTALGFAIAVSVITGVEGTGCRDTGSPKETTKRGQVFSAPAFIREFEKETGHKLFDLATPAIPGLPRVHRLDVADLHAPKVQLSQSAQELVSRSGHFSIYLYASARETRQSLRGSAPNKQGIYWTHEVVERVPPQERASGLPRSSIPATSLAPGAEKARGLTVVGRG
jgi:hypothetical protein